MGEGRGAYRVFMENLGERGHMEDPGVGGRIILRWIFKIGMGSMNWIELAQDKDRWLYL
jgi:hypothetical protein